MGEPPAMDIYRLLQVIYWLCLGLVLALSVARGSRPERIGVGALLVASLLTIWTARLPGWGYGSAQVGILAVDLLFLAILLTIVIESDRFWPIWASGFHLVGVATHLAKLSFPDILPQAYWAVQGMWAYPIMMAIAAGTVRPMNSQASAPA